MTADTSTCMEQSGLSVIVQHFARIPPTRTQQQQQQQREPPCERQTQPFGNSVFFSENPSLSWANGASDGLCQNVRGLVMFADLMRGQTPPLVSLPGHCRRLRRCDLQSLHAHWRKVRLPTCHGDVEREDITWHHWFHNHAAPRRPNTRTPIGTVKKNKNKLIHKNIIVGYSFWKGWFCWIHQLDSLNGKTGAAEGSGWRV